MIKMQHDAVFIMDRFANIAECFYCQRRGVVVTHNVIHIQQQYLACLNRFACLRPKISSIRVPIKSPFRWGKQLLQCHLTVIAVIFFQHHARFGPFDALHSAYLFDQIIQRHHVLDIHKSVDVIIARDLVDIAHTL